MSDTYSAKATDFQPDPHNANEGTERGVYMVETSIEQNGLGRSIVVSADGVVLAGNKTLQAAIDAGLVEARVIETDGNELVVVKRTDLESGTPEAARYAIADNRTSEVGLEWDVEELQWAEELGVELEDWFFKDELFALDAPILDSNNVEERDNQSARAAVRHGTLINIGAFVGFVAEGREQNADAILIERFGNGNEAIVAFLIWLHEKLGTNED